MGIKVTIVEPGNLRTDILSSNSMRMWPISAPYESVVGANTDRLQRQNGSQSGDPERAAAAIVRVAQMPEPPERLLLGSDALAFASSAARELAESDARWREISTSIDFPVGDSAR